MLGDEVFYSTVVDPDLQRFADFEGARLFGYRVTDPRSHGVVEFDAVGRDISLEEKPSQPRSIYAVPGLYVYDNGVVARAAGLKPSVRGELEITDRNRIYLELGKLNVEVLPRGTAWLASGTFNDLNDALTFVRMVETWQGLKVACREEIAWRLGLLDDVELRVRGETLFKSVYGAYPLGLLDE